MPDQKSRSLLTTPFHLHMAQRVLKRMAALSSRIAHTNRLRNVTEPLWLSRWNRASSCSAHDHVRARRIWITQALP